MFLMSSFSLFSSCHFVWLRKNVAAAVAGHCNNKPREQRLLRLNMNWEQIKQALVIQRWQVHRNGRAITSLFAGGFQKLVFSPPLYLVVELDFSLLCVNIDVSLLFFNMEDNTAVASWDDFYGKSNLFFKIDFFLYGRVCAVLFYDSSGKGWKKNKVFSFS